MKKKFTEEMAREVARYVLAYIGVNKRLRDIEIRVFDNGVNVYDKETGVLILSFILREGRFRKIGFTYTGDINLIRTNIKYGELSMDTLGQEIYQTVNGAYEREYELYQKQSEEKIKELGIQ